MYLFFVSMLVMHPGANLKNQNMETNLINDQCSLISQVSVPAFQIRGHSNSAHAGLGGRVIKMRENACMGEGEARSCVHTA